MKNLNKGMIITSTIAAAIAAMTLAGCGNNAAEITKNETVKAVQAVKSAEAEAPKTTEATKTEKAAEEKPAETTKKNENKKKTTKKTEKNDKNDKNGVAVTAKTTAKPAEVVPKQNAQAQTAKQTQAPATVIPDDVYPVWVEGDVYAGTYAEEIAGRGTMEITRNSDGTYSVQVDWSSSAAEKTSWNFSGEFNGRGVMFYNNCRKTNTAFDEYGNFTYDSYGNMTPCTIYTKGSGYIEFKDEGVLEWHDDMGDVCPGTTFVSCKPYNTKADEVGTAGSNYYANENTKANEVGTAGSNYRADDWEATGDFYEVGGNRISLEIEKLNGYDNSYYCTVRLSESAFDSDVYSFVAHYENDTLVYDCGAKSFVSYDSNGNMAENYIIDEGHFGSISYTGAAGLRWTDSDGSSYVFMHDITLA